jgi:hypothetical protein
MTRRELRTTIEFKGKEITIQSAMEQLYRNDVIVLPKKGLIREVKDVGGRNYIENTEEGFPSSAYEYLVWLIHRTVPKSYIKRIKFD